MTSNIYFINTSVSKIRTTDTLMAKGEEELEKKMESLGSEISGYVIQHIYNKEGLLLEVLFLGCFNGFTPSAQECLNIEHILKRTPTADGGFSKQYIS